MENTQTQSDLVVTDQERIKLDQQLNKTIYVADLPRGCSYMDLHGVFNDYSYKEILMKRTPEHFYYAFVIFEDQANGKLILDSLTSMIAKRAVQDLKFPMIKGCPARVTPYEPALAKVRSRVEATADNLSIFVAGFLALGWCHKELFEAFAKFGKILSSKASLTGDHKTKGYGYICYEKAESAAAAIAEMNNKLVNGARLSVKPYTARNVVSAKVVRNNLYVKDFPKDDFTEFDLIVRTITG